MLNEKLHSIWKLSNITASHRSRFAKCQSPYRASNVLKLKWKGKYQHSNVINGWVIEINFESEECRNYCTACVLVCAPVFGMHIIHNSSVPPAYSSFTIFIQMRSHNNVHMLIEKRTGCRCGPASMHSIRCARSPANGHCTKQRTWTAASPNIQNYSYFIFIYL